MRRSTNKKVKRNLSKWHRRKAGQKSGSDTSLLSSVREILRNAFKSALVKLILAAVGTTGLLGLLYENFVSNPKITVSIEGRVSDYKDPDTKLVGMPVFVGNTPFLTHTDSSGFFSLKVTFRKHDKSFKLSCGEYPYDVMEKDVDIPVEEPRTIQTHFNLYHLGGYPEPVKGISF